MANLPTGTVTFLFTDIEGSTALWEHDREAMQAALEQHDALLRQAIESRGGHVFKTVGDAFCAAFARANNALEAAIATQRALSGGDWSALGEAGPVRVRIGLHTGEASERDGDYYGPPVNRVARLEAAGHGGQLLLSLATQQIVRDALPDGCSLHDWGEHRLKDLSHTEHIFQLQGPDLPQVDTPPTTAEALHPRDRVRVVEADDEADVEAARADAGNAWSRLEAAVLSDEGEAVTLTPSEALDLARHKPADWREYRLGRIAEWSQPRYRLDGRFVGLTLLIDQGEESVAGRWAAKDERYEDLGDLLASADEPAIVVLGPPGGGKSTLLRRLELDTAIAELRGEGSSRVSFFISLNTYKPAEPGQPLPSPGRWLSERWAARSPDLPSLDDLLAQGRVTLLLDALNEMPAGSESDFHDRVGLWKDWLVQLCDDHAGNRVVFSCRSLDYSQSLSTPAQRIPQVRIEPLTDDQVKDFLELYSPGQWREIWAELEGRPQMEVLRSPYLLALLVEQVEASGELPAGRAALFTGFVRQALRREVERGSDLFKPGTLFTSRDLKRLAGWKWKSVYDLPERGILLPKLASLAHAMQSDRADGERSQVRIDLDDALDFLDDANDEAILAAGESLAVLDEDQAAEELMYIHQLVQEYFAARQLAREPNPELVRVEWRAAEINPSIDEVLDSLDPADPLPPLLGTGWEETTILAAAMTKDPSAFLRGVMETNVALAGRAAAQSELMPRLPEDLLDELRWALVERCDSPAADLRDRIACGYALGDLGDPRFERHVGPHGEYLMPPMVEIPAGEYPIGDDEPFETYGQIFDAHVPRHEVEIKAFKMARFPVTNAEWACFMNAGGYEDERWWDTKAGRAWRRGENTDSAIHANVRWWRDKYRSEPELLERSHDAGMYDDEKYERWRERLKMSDRELQTHLSELYPGGRLTEPGFPLEKQFNHPTQPVVGICWYEARAYCNWLSMQTGLPLRLPAEVEWEAAARGKEARHYSFGDIFARRSANTVDTKVKRTTPVGVFPEGRTPMGIEDLSGNVFEWTSSLFGGDGGPVSRTEYSYPYDQTDGREDADASTARARVVRGGSWIESPGHARAASRRANHPVYRHYFCGFRLVLAAPIS